MDLKCSKRELNVQIKWFHKWRVRVSDLEEQRPPQMSPA